MKEFPTVDFLKLAFVKGEFGLDETVRVGNVEYTNRRSTTHGVFDMVGNGTKGVVVYESMSDILLFLWGAQRNSLVPYDVRRLPKTILEAVDVEDRIIPDKVEVHFVNLPVSHAIVAKVDTGAEMCSLNAQNIQVNRQQGSVSFMCPQLSQNMITAQVAEQQQVKTSGGETTYRPVLKLTIKVKGKVLPDTLINLNDRSQMDEPMLLGENALKAGKFLVDPSLLKEAQPIPADLVNSLRNETVDLPSTLTEQATQKLYGALSDLGDITISDLVKLLRTQAIDSEF